jgi:hypothetical protein
MKAILTNEICKERPNSAALGAYNQAAMSKSVFASLKRDTRKTKDGYVDGLSVTHIALALQSTKKTGVFLRDTERFYTKKNQAILNQIKANAKDDVIEFYTARTIFGK